MAGTTIEGRMHDSGKRQTFGTGAVRDTAEGKTRPELITPFGLHRLAEWYRLGAIKYADRNWEAGMPYSRVTASIFRHLISWMMRDKTEDHLAAIAWNAFALMHYETMLERGMLPIELNDMPHYGSEQSNGQCLSLKNLKDSAPVTEDDDGEGSCSTGGWSPQTQALLNAASDGECVPVRIPSQREYTLLVCDHVVTGRMMAQEEPTDRLSRVYIAGPMRGFAKFNFPAFDEARDRAIELGFDPISPADMDRTSGVHEDHPPHLAQGPAMARTFATRDTQALLSLRAEDGDGIALLPGWEKSTGAVAEFFLARWLGLQVLNAETMAPFTIRDLIGISWIKFLKNTKNTLVPGSI